MIERIVFRDSIINIFKNPHLSKDKKLYSADSLMLFVGKNGSGKTDLFCSIFNHIVGKGDDSCRITFSDNCSKEDNFIVYYTPVPFGEFNPKKNERCYFYRAKNFIKTSISEEYRTTRESLIDSFEIKHKSILKLISFGWSDFEKLANDLLDNSENFDCYELSEIKKRISINPSLKNETNFLYEIRDIVKRACGDEFKLKLLAYKYCIETKRKTGLGFSHLVQGLGFSLKNEPSSENSRLRQSFNGALNRLIRFNERLDGVLYKSSRIELSAEQYLSIKDLLKSTSKVSNEVKSNDRKEDLVSIYFEKLSSGGAALLDQFTNLQIAINKIKESGSYSKKKNLILLIDEGDAFLHFEWQSKYVKYLNNYIDKLREDFETIQVFLSTHSAFLISEFPREAIIKLDDTESGIFNEESNFDDVGKNLEERTFATPLGEIISQVGNSPTIGSFAKEVIIELIADIKDGKSIANFRVEMIGDSIIRNQIYRMLEDKKND